MTELPRNAAGEVIDPARDRPGLAIRTLLGATCAGAAAVALVLWTVRRLLAGAMASDQPVLEGPAIFVLIMGSVSAIAFAAVITWFRLSRLSSHWRRGVFAMLSGFGTVIAAMLATPLDHFYGQAGLAAMGILSAILAILLLSFRREPA